MAGSVGGMTEPTSTLALRAEHPDLVPSRAHADDAGLDLKSNNDVTLAPGERAVIPTGISVALPANTVGLVCPRSGLAAKKGITVVNAPGIIDAGYRGEIKVVLLNTDSTHECRIARGDRIAQLVITPVATPVPVVVDSLDDAERGAKGFGSSGGFDTTVMSDHTQEA